MHAYIIIIIVFKEKSGHISRTIIMYPLIVNKLYNIIHACYDAKCALTQMIYQHLEKFNREKNQSVRQDLNPFYSVPYIRAQPLGHHRCCCWQPLFQLFAISSESAMWTPVAKTPIGPGGLGLRNGVSLFTGLDYWTGLLDWTTGLTFDTKIIARTAIEFGV